MCIISAAVPYAARLAAVGPELSKAARYRLKWMNHYRTHGGNAALTCRVLRDQPPDLLPLAAPVRSCRPDQPGGPHALPEAPAPAYLEPRAGGAGPPAPAPVPPVGEGQGRGPAPGAGLERSTVASFRKVMSGYLVEKASERFQRSASLGNRAFPFLPAPCLPALTLALISDISNNTDKTKKTLDEGLDTIVNSAPFTLA